MFKAFQKKMSKGAISMVTTLTHNSSDSLDNQLVFPLFCFLFANTKYRFAKTSGKGQFGTDLFCWFSCLFLFFHLAGRNFKTSNLGQKQTPSL